MILVDPREGSRNLVPHLMTHGLQVIGSQQIQSDVEFLGCTPLTPDAPATPIGIEHKSAKTGDIFNSLADGRLTGVQLPRMVDAYPWVRYLMIEGNTRRSGRDGILEVNRFKGKWEAAYSRNGAAWTYREYKLRLESIAEFWSAPHVPGTTRIVETYDEYESAAWIADIYAYWQKPYWQHSSAGGRHKKDLKKAAEAAAGSSPNSMFLPRNQIEPSLAQRWANEIDGIGPLRSAYVAQTFPSALSLATASAAEWAAVEWREKQGRGKGKHFSAATIADIRKQIGHTD